MRRDSEEGIERSQESLQMKKSREIKEKGDSNILIPFFLQKLSSTFFKRPSESEEKKAVMTYQKKKDVAKVLENPKNHYRSASYNTIFSKSSINEGAQINKSDGYNNLLTIAETEENLNSAHTDRLRRNELQQLNPNPIIENQKSNFKHKRFSSIQVIKSKENFLLPGSSKNILEKNDDNMSDKSNMNCLICYTENPDAVFMECGHGGVCYDCSLALWKSTGECYLCREKIIQVIQIDLDYKGDKYIKVISSTQMVEEKGI